MRRGARARTVVAAVQSARLRVLWAVLGLGLFVSILVWHRGQLIVGLQLLSIQEPPASLPV